MHDAGGHSAVAFVRPSVHMLRYVHAEDSREELGGEDDGRNHGQEVNDLVHPVLLLVERLVRQRLGPAHLPATAGKGVLGGQRDFGLR